MTLLLNLELLVSILLCSYDNVVYENNFENPEYIEVTPNLSYSSLTDIIEERVFKLSDILDGMKRIKSCIEPPNYNNRILKRSLNITKSREIYGLNENEVKKFVSDFSQEEFWSFLRDIRNSSLDSIRKNISLLLQKKEEEFGKALLMKGFVKELDFLEEKGDYVLGKELYETLKVQENSWLRRLLRNEGFKDDETLYTLQKIANIDVNNAVIKRDDEYLNIGSYENECESEFTNENRYFPLKNFMNDKKNIKTDYKKYCDEEVCVIIGLGLIGFFVIGMAIKILYDMR